MAFDSKYTGEEVEALLDKVNEGGGGVVETIVSACKCSVAFLGDIVTLLVNALSGKGIAYKLVNGSGGSSSYTADGSTSSLSAGASASGTCDSLSITQATNLEEVEYTGDLTLQWQVSTSTAQQTIKKATWVCSKDYTYSGESLFRNLRALESVSLVGGKLTSGRYMFYYCQNLKEVNAQIDTSRVTNMSYMFYYCSSLVDVSALAGWDTSRVTNMSYMFYYCSSLVDVSALAGWDTSRVMDMSYMFYYCSSLVDVSALAGWDTSRVMDMDYMFYDCSSLVDVSALAGWDTSEVMYMYSMFYNCSSLVDVSALANWDTSEVMYMDSMFYNCSSLTRLVLNWDVANVESFGEMFSGCSSLTTVEGSISGISDSINFEDCPLTRDSFLVIANGLASVSGKTLMISTTTMGLLSDEDKDIVTNKGWDLTT